MDGSRLAIQNSTFVIHWRPVTVLVNWLHPLQTGGLKEGLLGRPLHFEI